MGSRAALPSFIMRMTFNQSPSMSLRSVRVVLTTSARYTGSVTLSTPRLAFQTPYRLHRLRHHTTILCTLARQECCPSSISRGSKLFPKPYLKGPSQRLQPLSKRSASKYVHETTGATFIRQALRTRSRAFYLVFWKHSALLATRSGWRTRQAWPSCMISS